MCYTVNTYLNASQLEVLTGKKCQEDSGSLFQSKLSGFSHPLLPTSTQGSQTIGGLKWGLIPDWVGSDEQALEIQRKTLNARAETLVEKASFRESLDAQRAIVWVRGFYDYRTEGKTKRPFYISNTTELLPLAGLYCSNSWGRSVTIITVQANSRMEFIHNTKLRMPSILTLEHVGKWLDPQTSFHQVSDLLNPYQGDDWFDMELNPARFKKMGGTEDPKSIPFIPTPEQGSLF